MIFIQWVKTFFSLLFPHVCLGCRAWQDKSLCQTCLLTLSPQLSIRTDLEGIDKTYSLFAYEGLIKHLLHDYKLNKIIDHKTIVSELMLRTFYELLPVDDFFNPDTLFIPVPLHPKRLRQRGFDQVKQIFEPLLNSLNKKCSPVVIRKKNTPFLHTFNKKEREKTLKDAFELALSFDPNGKTIVLLDDILTSGSTVKAVADVLRKRGCARITVLTLCGVAI